MTLVPYSLYDGQTMHNISSGSRSITPLLAFGIFSSGFIYVHALGVIFLSEAILAAFCVWSIIWEKITWRIFLFWTIAIIYIVVYLFVDTVIHKGKMEYLYADIGAYILFVVNSTSVYYLLRKTAVSAPASCAGLAVALLCMSFITGNPLVPEHRTGWYSGLGGAVTIASFAVAWLIGFKSWLLPVPFIMVAIGAANNSDRGTMALMLIVGLISVWNSLGGFSIPRRNKVTGIFLSACVGLGMMIIGVIGMSFAAERGWLPTAMAEKIKTQSRSGEIVQTLIAARPDTYVAALAISRRPVLGYGSSGDDSTIRRALLETLVFANTDAWFTRGEDRLPFHSAALMAWARGGVIGGFLWAYILGTTVIVLHATFLWRNRTVLVLWPCALLFLYKGIFEPGPPRVLDALLFGMMLWGAEWISVINNIQDARVSERFARSIMHT